MVLIQNQEIQSFSNQILLGANPEDLSLLTLSEKEIAYINQKISQKINLIHLNRLDTHIFIVWEDLQNKEVYKIQENYRSRAFETFQLLEKERIENIQLISTEENSGFLLDFTEGLLLSTYKFLKYKTEKPKSELKEIGVFAPGITKNRLDELFNLIRGNFKCRDLVNEPVLYLTAEKLSEEIEALGKEAGFNVEVFHKAKIESLGMVGLLTVNKGSVDPPTFTVLEYKPENAAPGKTFVLVGKGVVFDTGGLSLKPTPASMDFMKCDMAGGAAVAGTIYALAKNKVPLHVVGLIPATDNRPGGNAITPCDVITMMNGKTVEILNTDAEGRLILADALLYAKRYQPTLVIDLATLTGAAAMAIGKEAMVMMGTASEAFKMELRQSGAYTHERLVEFPLWEEYAEQLKSDIADISNIGKLNAGAITAGKFLEYFTDYPWIHLDIAGTAFLNTADKYRGPQGTGSGVRCLYHFLKKQVNSSAE